MRRVALDDRQLAGQPAVDQAGGEAVEPGEEAFRETDMQFPRIAYQRGDDLAGHVGGAVALAVKCAVERRHGVSVHRGIDGARHDVHHRNQRIGQLPPQRLRERAQPGLGCRVGGKTGERKTAKG